MKGAQLANFAIILVGLVFTLAAVFEWDRIMYWRNFRWLTDLLGEKGTRGYHFVMGLVLVVVGVLALTGVIKLY